MPYLSLTCKKVLGEMWSLSFPGAPRYKVTVVNLDYFPLFRFLRNLQGVTKVRGELVDIVLKEDEESDGYGKKFTKVKRLIEMHWLEGLPLWGCLTGLREEPDPDGPAEMVDKRAFWSWIYAVRQIVALYKIEPAVWRSTSIKYLQRYEALKDDDFDAATIAHYSNVELVQAIIEALSEAIEYRLGWTGNFKDDDGSGYQEFDSENVGYFFCPTDDNEKVACQLEHAIVLVADQYSIKISRILQSELGPLYAEWEAYEDQKEIPKGLLL